jgi:methylmalonyl-CoA/ethylmalonyl-CoA epimerase
MGKEKEARIESLLEVVIAVEDLEKAVALYEHLFGITFDLEWPMPHEHMKVKACSQLGSTQLQLVSTTSPNGVIGRFIKRHGEGLNHIAFKVSNLRKLVNELREKGVTVIPEEISETDKALYSFVHPKSAHGVLVELVELK